MSEIYDMDDVYLSEGEIFEYAPCNCTFEPFHHVQAEVVRIYDDGDSGCVAMEARLLESVSIPQWHISRSPGDIVNETDWYCTDSEDPDNPPPRFIVVPQITVPKLVTVQDADAWLDDMSRHLQKSRMTRRVS